MNIIIYDHVYIDLLYSNIMGQTLFWKDDSNRQALVKSNAGFLRKAWSPYIHAGGRGWGLRSRILGGKQGIPRVDTRETSEKKQNDIVLGMFLGQQQKWIKIESKKSAAFNFAKILFQIIVVFLNLSRSPKESDRDLTGRTTSSGGTLHLKADGGLGDWGIGGWGRMLRKGMDILEKRRGNFGWLFFF